MNNNDIQKQLAKLRRDKKLLWLGILFFVLVVMWILVSIFATSKTSSISTELKNLAKPFVPRLESKVFDEIGLKRIFIEEELSFFPIYIFDEKNIDGKSKMIDIMLPLASQAEEILKELTLQATESATQATESASQGSETVNVATDAASEVQN